MLNNLVSITDSKAVTTSLIVAEAFEKQHKDVLRAIVKVECPEEFGRRNFTPSSYVNDQNKPQPMYQITRDGFMLVAMGFTGKKATEFKIRFIEAFNAMEQALVEEYGIDRRVQVDHNHTRGITNLHGLDISYRLDLTKLVLNPNRKSLQVIEKLTGVDMSDLVEEWSIPADSSSVPGIDTWLKMCGEAPRTSFSARYRKYLSWLKLGGSYNTVTPPVQKQDDKPIHLQATAGGEGRQDIVLMRWVSWHSVPFVVVDAKHTKIAALEGSEAIVFTVAEYQPCLGISPQEADAVMLVKQRFSGSTILSHQEALCPLNKPHNKSEPRYIKTCRSSGRNRLTAFRKTRA
jgi:Rha family phage regulatory protein